MTPLGPSDRLARARVSLDGLSVGDAFGERFFVHPHALDALLEARALPADQPGGWPFTDDTVMALSIVDVLDELARIDSDRLAALFAARYQLDPGRGYGGTAHGILTRIAIGEPWRDVASSVFDGGGSMGNGAAMRAAPIGAYFSDDFARVVVEATSSAAPTHAHPEGVAGAVAIAIAAAWTERGGDRASDLFDVVLSHTPDGPTRAGVELASRLDLRADVRTAVRALGNGSRVISEDTVPFCVWSVARAVEDGSRAGEDLFEEAMWTTVSGLGDRDTTCAIVGGVLACSPRASVPRAWRASREPLENMARERLRFAR